MFTLPRGPETPSLDRVYIGTQVVAVIDGASPKKGFTHDDVMELLEAINDSLTRAEEAKWALDEFLSDFRDRWTWHNPQPASLGSTPAATIAVLSMPRRELWRIGDPWVAIGEKELAPRVTIENQLAAQRQEITRDFLNHGWSIKQLREEDPGRSAVLDSIIESNILRNVVETGGFAALDGSPVPEEFQEVWDLVDDDTTVTLATDGFLSAASSLETANDEVIQRVRHDPLMISDPPATKGVLPGNWSFDDRTYLKVSCHHVRGCTCGR